MLSDRLERLSLDFRLDAPGNITGWSLGRHPQIQGPDRGQTAGVYDFGYALAGLLNEAIRRTVFTELGRFIGLRAPLCTPIATARSLRVKCWTLSWTKESRMIVSEMSSQGRSCSHRPGKPTGRNRGKSESNYTNVCYIIWFTRNVKDYSCNGHQRVPGMATSAC